jgi:hypothetical protein
MAPADPVDKEQEIPTFVVCPKCGVRIRSLALWDSDKPGEPSEPGFWGGPNDKRVIVKSCYSKDSHVVHFKVNDQDRMAYLKKLRPAKRRRKRKKK